MPPRRQSFTREVAASYLVSPSRLQVARQSYILEVSHIHLCDWRRSLVCCICIVGELCNKMDIDAATDAVKEEHLPVEETDDSCVFKYFEIVPLTTDTDRSCTTEFVSGDCPAEVKEENSTVMKQEADDVCFVVWY